MYSGPITFLSFNAIHICTWTIFNLYYISIEPQLKFVLKIPCNSEMFWTEHISGWLNVSLPTTD